MFGRFGVYPTSAHAVHVHEDLLDMLLPPSNRQHDPAQGRLLRTPFLQEWSGRRPVPPAPSRLPRLDVGQVCASIQSRTSSAIASQPGSRIR